MGSGATAAFLAGRPREEAATHSVVTQNRARNVIFVHLLGAPSHTDTFDFKEASGFTPLDRMKPDTINGIRWPVGLLPKLAVQLPNMAIVRSVSAGALEHSLSSAWVQMAAIRSGRWERWRTHRQYRGDRKRAAPHAEPGISAFLALNSPGATGSGYLPWNTALQDRARRPPGHEHSEGAAFPRPPRLAARIGRSLRINSPLGATCRITRLSTALPGLMYNPAVEKAFQVAPQDRVRYGSTHSAMPA